MTDSNQVLVGRWKAAEVALARGDVGNAASGYKSLLDVAGFGPYAALRLSMIESGAGELRLGIAYALQAHQRANTDPALLALLAKRLLTIGETRRALECADHLSNSAGAVTDLLEVGKMFSDHMEPACALRLISAATRQGWQPSPIARYLIGLNLMYLGDLGGAFEHTQACIASEPDFAPAYWTMAKIGSEIGRSERIDRLQSMLASKPQSAPDSPLLGYALHHELDALGDTKRAWPVLLEAMRSRRAQVRYDEMAEQQLFDRVHQRLMKTNAGHLSDDPAKPLPLFIVGMPRTGTTIIERQISSMADVASAGELHDLVWQMRWIANTPGPMHLDTQLADAFERSEEAKTLGARYSEHTAWRGGASAYYTDKWPANFMAIYQILKNVPGAKVIWLTRSPMDACFSNLKEWFASSYYYSYDFGEVARHFGRYARLTQSVRQLEGPRIALVGYEDFVMNPWQETRRIMQQLGLPERAPGTMPSSIVTTASSVQVRSGVTRDRVGASNRYASYLHGLKQALSTVGISA